ncbi:LIM/homeobox protein Awh-like [Xenia sp. Carnegie-2017]|uniref:LIM/homeobox protein Awh-like n=1 Tax=Xenia sp. Carnegie-2017 TaxID=2897299 RepID=UPI001F0330F2|nr:LIM/homeobox protein Awh-like [Xenia sp. Carnegie-2017]
MMGVMNLTDMDESVTEEVGISAAVLSQSVSEQAASQLNRCPGCNEVVLDRHVLKVDDVVWHVCCLKCCVCQCELGLDTICYSQQGQIYCKEDYARKFGKKCSACLRSIECKDYVRKAKTLVYHLDCFSCSVCGRQLATGERFILDDKKLYCQLHCAEFLQVGSFPRGGDETNSLKRKRVRTTFSDDQLQVLNASFIVDPNPDGHDLERIAKRTGLTKRVTQVWFQNSRARLKKQTSSSE